MAIYIKSAKILQDIVPFLNGTEFKFKDGINLLVGDQGCGKSSLLAMLQNHKEYDVEVKIGDHRTNKYKPVDVVEHEKKNVKKRHIKEEFAGVIDVQYEKNPTDTSVFFDVEKHNPRVMVGDTGSRGELVIVKSFLNYIVSNTELGMNDSFVDSLQSASFMYAESIRQDLKEDFLAEATRLKSHGQVILPMLKQLNESKGAMIFLDEPETSLSIRSQYLLANILLQTQFQDCQSFVATHSQILIESVDEVFSLEHLKWMPSKEFIATQLG